MHVDIYIIYFPVTGIVIHYSREIQRVCDIRCAVYVLDSCHSNIYHTILLKDPSKGKYKNRFLVFVCINVIFDDSCGRKTKITNLTITKIGVKQRGYVHNIAFKMSMLTITSAMQVQA